MPELPRPAVALLVIVMPTNQRCACGHVLVNGRAEVVKSQYLAIRDGALVARCPKCRAIQTIGHPARKDPP